MTQPVLNFGNWIRIQRVMYMLVSGSILLIASFLVRDTYAVLIAISGIILLLTAIFILYIFWKFSPTGGDLQTSLWQLTIDHLQLTTNAKVLDIGTGNGAIAIMLAQSRPDVTVIGVDMWHSDWNYSLAQCIANAGVAKVSASTQFDVASADSLPFPDSSFDAVISHFVFHEVKTLQDKCDAIKEAIRVLKPGGSFSFHDMFLDTNYYGSREILLQKMESFGISSFTFTQTNSLIAIPKLLSGRRALGPGALLWGSK